MVCCWLRHSLPSFVALGVVTNRRRGNRQASSQGAVGFVRFVNSLLCLPFSAFSSSLVGVHAVRDSVKVHWLKVNDGGVVKRLRCFRGGVVLGQVYGDGDSVVACKAVLARL